MAYDLQEGDKSGLALTRVTKRLLTSVLTLDLYSHVTPEMAKLAAESLNGLLAKRKNPAKSQGEE
ncbi:MAG: hypothetical protein KGZ41_04525 [Dethiobacter sp.]|nr:hypothetical protein [Dethiobacter sp.]